MDSELSAVLQSIKTKTGIDVTVSGAEGEPTPIFVTKSLPDSDEGEQVAEMAQGQGVTYFSVRFKRKDYLCAINGEDAVAQNYARLIKDLIESLSDKEKGRSKQEELRFILLGDYNKTQTQKFVEKYAVPDYACFALVFPTGERNDEIVEFLQNYDDHSASIPLVMDDGSCVFIKFMDGETQSVFRSPTEYANLLSSSLQMELNFTAKIGVGNEVRRFNEISVSYQEAATALRMANVFSARGNVHTYREFLMVKMLEDVPKFKLREYIDALLSGEAATVLSDEDLMNTAEEFLENSLNVSETSRNLYMHRNTLMYRLDKIEKLTGLNIRNFGDAVTFRLITILYKILN